MSFQRPERYGRRGRWMSFPTTRPASAAALDARFQYLCPSSHLSCFMIINILLVLFIIVCVIFIIIVFIVASYFTTSVSCYWLAMLLLFLYMLHLDEATNGTLPTPWRSRSTSSSSFGRRSAPTSSCCRRARRWCACSSAEKRSALPWNTFEIFLRCICKIINRQMITIMTYV